MNVRKVYIGTSGYSYPHWEDGVFYPKELLKTKQLEYYSEHFDTVEMNYPFYRLPSSKNFSNWKKTVSKEFVFAVKVSRYITHVKRLHCFKTPWKAFLKRALYLGDKLGPFLFQLPPNFKKDLERLEEFIKTVQDLKLRFVLEFRHPSWFSEDVYQILKREKNISLCLADSPHWLFEEVIVGNFVYIRMHGGKILYTSNYSEKELKYWSEKIKGYLNQGLDVYIYFNNDSMGYAVKNARQVLKYLKIL